MKKQIFVPGRTELAGNHTDHQNGRTLTSAIHLGIFGTAETNGSGVIHVQSEGFKPFDVQLTHLSVRTREFGTPKSLVRGMVASFKDLGLNVGGFDAKIRSTLPVGSGLSSSAAFSVLIGRMFSELFNNGEVDPLVIARAGQKSENRYFGKPCGLTSQLACAIGQTIYADLKTGELETIKASFAMMGLTLCLTTFIQDEWMSIPVAALLLLLPNLLYILCPGAKGLDIASIFGVMAPASSNSARTGVYAAAALAACIALSGCTIWRFVRRRS